MFGTVLEAADRAQSHLTFALVRGRQTINKRKK